MSTGRIPEEPLPSSNWFACENNDDLLVSPFDEGFNFKKEVFEDVDISNIPMQMLSDPSIGPSSLDAMSCGSSSFPPQTDMPQDMSSSPNYTVPRSTGHMRHMGGGGSGNREQYTLQHQRKMSMPEPRRSNSFRPPPRKRKSLGSNTEYSSRSSPSPGPTTSPASHTPRKTTHNMIEKRYRTNLNDKIAALRDAVPSLRVMVPRVGREGEPLDDMDYALEAENLGGLAPAHKLNKATVLSKATEYIAHLERSNTALMRENDHLRSRMTGLEMMMLGTGPTTFNGVWS